MSRDSRTREREWRRNAERSIDRGENTRYRWTKAGIGRCECCPDVSPVIELRRGTRTVRAHDMHGRQARAEIRATPRVCLYHAVVTEARATIEEAV
jgi:hypothetical protein